MKIEKYIDIKNENKIWRLLINQSGKLLIETRDINKKEVFFSCINLSTSENILNNFQFEEKFWLGIEAFYNDIIFFHSFPKPDMPNHKEIIAFNIYEKKIIWHNRDLAFLFCFENVVYGFKQGFEGKFYYSVDYNSGETVEQLSDEKFNLIQTEYRRAEDKKYDDYIFPENLEKLGTEKSLIINEDKIIGDIEAISYNDKYIITSFNKELSPGKFTNIFKIYEKNNMNEIFTKVLDAGIDKLATDTYFIYKELLFLIIEKSNLEIYKLEK